MAFENTQQELNNLRNLTWQNGKLIELMENGAGAISKEVDEGKKLIAQAINNAGGEASADESLNELAEDIEQMPIVNVSAFKFSEVPNLAKAIAETPHTNAGQSQLIKDTLIELNDFEGDITKIEVYTFQSCKNLISVYLPECTTVGNYSFPQCTSLTNINLPKCLSIGLYAFQDCPIVKIDLPECITIGQYGFYRVINYLKEIILPKVTTIESNAFRPGSSSTVDVPLEVLDLSSISSINNTVFNGSRCVSLRKIVIKKDYDVNINLAVNLIWDARLLLVNTDTKLELYQNFRDYFIANLYDHETDGITRTCRIGFYATLYADAISGVNNEITTTAQQCLSEAQRKGWTLSA